MRLKHSLAASAGLAVAAGLGFFAGLSVATHDDERQNQTSTRCDDATQQYEELTEQHVPDSSDGAAVEDVIPPAQLEIAMRIVASNSSCFEPSGVAVSEQWLENHAG